MKRYWIDRDETVAANEVADSDFRMAGTAKATLPITDPWEAVSLPVGDVPF